MKRLFLSFVVFVVVLCLGGVAPRINADGVYHNLAGGGFAQSWTTTTLISTDDIWTGVPSVEGYRGDALTGSTGADPQTLTLEDTSPVLDIIANQANPNTNATGGVAEFDGIANTAVALQGSGTADAPYVVIYLNTTGRENVQVNYDLRDLDGSTDNAIQPVALHYRVGTTGI
ncbi:MAG: hypothetical protein AAB288_04245, partial [Acidobacteriota bacterium]